MKARRRTRSRSQEMKNAHVRDAVALCDFLRFLEEEITAGERTWTESSAATELESLRAAQKHYVGLSFASISAYSSNGAVIHYEPTDATDRAIGTDSLFLLDSGGHPQPPTRPLSPLQLQPPNNPIPPFTRSLSPHPQPQPPTRHSPPPLTHNHFPPTTTLPTLPTLPPSQPQPPTLPTLSTHSPPFPQHPLPSHPLSPLLPPPSNPSHPLPPSFHSLSPPPSPPKPPSHPHAHPFHPLPLLPPSHTTLPHPQPLSPTPSHPHAHSPTPLPTTTHTPQPFPPTCPLSPPSPPLPPPLPTTTTTHTPPLPLPPPPADGTTDVTRTMHYGEPTEEQIEAYTRVLAGHVDLASVVFPEGTADTRLDVLARRHLYEVGLDYRHGTGHGIGMFLGVHE
ncbi:hypothetical protein C7M84_010564, partial [Penaeus vannamei]